MVAGLIRRRQDEQDAQAARQAADSHSRSALLAATGRQTCEQLEKAQAALALLADPGTAYSPDQRATLASQAWHAVGRADRIIADLRDLRHLQAGGLDTYLRAVDLDEVLAAALEDLGPGCPDIMLRVPEDMPDVIADADLLARILTALTAEALHRSPPGLPPALAAASHDGRAEIRVTDHGPPQSPGSEPDSLGFRLARDLTEAMGDTLRCTEHQGGGRTVIITLPASRGPTGADQ
jgi:two-component system sensor histidine kinase KdpD